MLVNTPPPSKPIHQRSST